MADHDDLEGHELDPAAIEKFATTERHARVADACKGTDIAALYSAWQVSIDFLFRTHIAVDVRKVDFWNLRTVASKLGTLAYDRKQPHAALLKLEAILHMQVPQTWFRDGSAQERVQAAIAEANVEVVALVRSSVRKLVVLTEENDPEYEQGAGGAVATDPEPALFFLVSQLVTLARLIMGFRANPHGHAIWHQELEPKLRPSLRALILAERAADKTRSDASIALHNAQQGRCDVGTHAARRSEAAAQKRYDRANARWEAARLCLHRSSVALGRHQRLLIRRKVRELAEAFEHLHARFAAKFHENIVEITRRSTGPQLVESWSGASCCEVLDKIAMTLIEALNADERDAGYLLQERYEHRLGAIDRAAWAHLHDGARKEASFLAAQREAQDDHLSPSTSTTPPPRGATQESGHEQAGATVSWPPPEHPTVAWSELTQMERDQVMVFVKREKETVLEVPEIAKKARGQETPNRHDKSAARALDKKGLTEKVGRTGRRLVAVPRGMPK